MRISNKSALITAIPNEVGDLLPDYAHPDELGGIPGAAYLFTNQLSAHDLAFQQTQIWQAASQIGLRNMIAGVGIPRGPLATSVINILGAFDPQQSAEQRITQIANAAVNGLLAMAPEVFEEALADAVDAGVGVAIDTVSAIPFVGLFVKIAWLFGKTAYKASKMDPYAREELFPPSVFSPSLDRSILNSVLRQLQSNDWSTLFYPPSVGKSQSWKQAIYTTNLIGGGKRFIGGNQPMDPCRFDPPPPTPCLGGTGIPNSGGLVEDPYLGFVPGTGWLHRAIETTGKHEIREIGTVLLPSSQNQASWLWNHITRTNSPAAFTIHCDLAESFWQTYIEDLRVAIRSSSFNAEMKRRIFAAYDRNKHGDKIFGWGDGSKEIEYAPGPRLRALRQRQLAFCDTLTVAYVDDTFGAAQDPVVRAKINKRQQDLLGHPAVCDVDLSNVRDVLLHDEIVERRKGHNCMVAGTDSLVAGGIGPAQPEPPEVPNGFATPEPDGIIPGPRVWPKYVAGGAAVAALAGVGIYCRKDLQRAIRNLRLRIPI